MPLARATLAAASLYAVSAFSQAAPQETVSLTGSLEELVELEQLLMVSTVSKTAERITDAPGVISVITSEEIRRYGARNLLELLERAPATYGIGSYLYPQNVLSVRGDVLTHFDNHVLILIDGRPFRESIYGGLNAALYTAFPIDAISRIEVIRGPGSVLYGTNAYAGVVNIITRPGGEEAGLRVSGGAGDLGARSVAVSGHGAPAGVKLSGAVRYYENEGFPFEATDERGNLRSANFGENALGAHVRGEYGGLTAGFFFGHSNQTHLGATAVWPAKSLLTQRGFADVGYRHAFSDRWSAQVNGTWNYFLQDFFLGAGPFVAVTHDLQLEANTQLTPVDGLNVILGGTVSRYSGWADNAGFPSVPGYAELWLSSYLQVDWRPIPLLKLVAGGQLNKPSGIAANFVPRAGVILNFTPEFGAKLLYGQAFRSAMEAENAIEVPGVLFGSPSLRPETVATIDAQLFYRTTRYEAAATAFRSTQSNLITRVPITEGDPSRIYANRGDLTSIGVELEGRATIVDGLTTTGSFSLSRNQTSSGTVDITHMPNPLGKIGVHYTPGRGIGLGSWFQYVGPSSIVTLVNPNADLVNPPANGYGLWTANLSLELRELLGAPSIPAIRVDIYGQNLLDAEIHHPEFSRRAINTIPGRPGRTLFTQVTLEL